MSDYRRTTPRSTPIPAYDPGPSGEFAAEVLAEAGVTGVLIGRLAVWSWLSHEGSHRFTKGVDLAVTRAELPAVRAWLAARGLTQRELPIGGVAVRLPGPGGDEDAPTAVRVDFIDRTGKEYGDFGDVVAEAIADARSRNQTVRVGGARLLVVSATYLVLLKLVAGCSKDDDDIDDLLRQAEVDVDFLRGAMRRHPELAGFRSRFEDKLARLGHPQARRDYGDS